MAKQSLSKELSNLGKEVKKAVLLAGKSPEFKKLESELVKGTKAISSSLLDALKAARKSPETKKLGSKMGRVLKLGRKEGEKHARVAADAAADKIRQATKALKDFQKKAKK